jgi:hypothetical protein
VLLLRRLAIVPIFPLALALLATTPAAALTLGTSSSATCLDNGVVQDQLSGGPSSSCTYQVNQGGFLSRQLDMDGTVTAVAAFRSVGVDANAHISQNASVPQPATVSLAADASMQDVIVLDASFPDGTPVPGGFFSLSAIATGTMSFTGFPLSNASQAVLDVSILVGGVGVAADQFLIDPASPTVGIGLPVAAVIPWVQGTAIPVIMQVSLSGDLVLAVDGDVSLDVDFSGSLDWLGISNVTDTSGTPVASFTAKTPEGLDWAVALPEPALGWLLLVPAGLAVAQRRRR